MENCNLNYITRSGRTSKKLIDFQFNPRKKANQTRMPLVPTEDTLPLNDRLENNDQREQRASSQQREEVERLRATLYTERREMEKVRQEQREGISQLQAEIKKLQAQLQNQPGQNDDVTRAQVLENERHEALQRVEQPARQNAAITEICDYISNINHTQLDVKYPKFSDENSRNPLEFLCDLEKYFSIKNVPDHRKISIVELALENKAQYWISLQNKFTRYEQFREQFINEFYSIPIQVKVKNTWASRKYREIDGNLQTYYYKQLKEANYIMPKLSTFERNYTIVQQFPHWIKESLAAVNYEDVNAVTQTLAQLDAINLEKRRERERRQYNPQTSNTYTQQARVRHIYTRPNHNNRQRGASHYNPRHQDTYNNRYRYNNERLDFPNRNPRNTHIQNNSTVQILPDTRHPPPGYRNASNAYNAQTQNNMGANNHLN